MHIVFFTDSNNKTRLENSYLDIDRTRIYCDKNEKIGQAIIKYNTKDNENNNSNDIFKNSNKYNIFLWCTKKPNNWDTYKVYSPVY